MIAGYFKGEAPGGAIPNGSRIVKVAIEEGDAHPLGSRGAVISSLKTPTELLEKYPKCPFLYFVVWDDMPGIPISVVSFKIQQEPPV